MACVLWRVELGIVYSGCCLLCCLLTVLHPIKIIRIILIDICQPQVGILVAAMSNVVVGLTMLIWTLRPELLRGHRGGLLLRVAFLRLQIAQYFKILYLEVKHLCWHFLLQQTRHSWKVDLVVPRPCLLYLTSLIFFQLPHLPFEALWFFLFVPIQFITLIFTGHQHGIRSPAKDWGNFWYHRYFLEPREVSLPFDDVLFKRIVKWALEIGMITENFISIGSIWRETMADGRPAVAQVEVTLLSWAVAVVMPRKYGRRWHKPSPGHLCPDLHNRLRFYFLFIVPWSSSLLKDILQHINRCRYPI